MAQLAANSAEINRRNREFWAEQLVLMKKRMANETVLNFAINILNSKENPLHSIHFQDSFEKALETAAYAKDFFIGRLVRKAGGSRKADTLNRLIADIVHEKPSIKWPEFLVKLKLEHGQGVIVDIDDEVINFVTHDGRIKSVSIEALKHRFTRARKSLVSESR